MGWEVEGQEVDATAAEQARTRHGLRVHLGALADVALSGSTFDVVAMNHVIEHVPDPLALLKECRRILKPGGRLIAVTPNVNSLGHHRFGACWRGLEPPRHLHLFSVTTLNHLGVQAGFHSVRTSTTAANAQFLAEASLCIARTVHHHSGARVGWGLVIQSLLFQFRAMIVHLARKDSGEECVLNAVK
jgi:2-polyprenyl-3-methyl-5-hydroxy-6-metoxy-1,4-benzoquinol methylase